MPRKAMMSDDLRRRVAAPVEGGVRVELQRQILHAKGLIAGIAKRQRHAKQLALQFPALRDRHGQLFPFRTVDKVRRASFHHRPRRGRVLLQQLILLNVFALRDGQGHAAHGVILQNIRGIPRAADGRTRLNRRQKAMVKARLKTGAAYVHALLVAHAWFLL